MASKYEGLVVAATTVARDLGLLLAEKERLVEAEKRLSNKELAIRRNEIERLRAMHQLLTRELDQIVPEPRWLRYWVAAIAVAVSATASGAIETVVGLAIEDRIRENAQQVEQLGEVDAPPNPSDVVHGVLRCRVVTHLPSQANNGRGHYLVPGYFYFSEGDRDNGFLVLTGSQTDRYGLPAAMRNLSYVRANVTDEGLRVGNELVGKVQLDESEIATISSLGVEQAEVLAALRSG